MTEITSPVQPRQAVTVQDLKVHFPIHAGVLGRTSGSVKAVDGVSFHIHQGEVYGLVGESGCGKTTTAQAILGLNSITDGSIKLAIGPWQESPVELRHLTAASRRQLRRTLQVVFQDPYSSLDPRMTVRAIIEEPLRVHRIPDREQRLQQLLNDVGLSPALLERYPHEFSGGQRQRICIARALAIRPSMIVADEPVSALDVSIQAQIINLLQDMQREYDLTILFISHDLAVVRHLTNRLAIMYLGKIMESGTNEQIFAQPRHPYTRLLLESIPQAGGGRRQHRAPGKTDELTRMPSVGCPFFPRCPDRQESCQTSEPHLMDTGDGHLVACPFWH